MKWLWELRGGALSFRDLQAACGGISSSVLNDRLGELREAEIVANDGGPGFELTGEGRRLIEAYGPLEAWAGRWARRVDTPD